MESQLWHEDACSQNGGEQEHFEDACIRMVVSDNCGMNMLEGDEQEHFADPSQIKTLQIQLKSSQGKINKVNASRLQATAAAHHWQEACRAEKASKKAAHKRKRVLYRAGINLPQTFNGSALCKMKEAFVLKKNNFKDCFI